MSFGKIEYDSKPDPRIDAYFDRASCTLWVDGDDADNFIRVSVDDDGSIVVNDGAVRIEGDRPTDDNTCYIVVDGGAGHDILIGNTGGDRTELIGGSGMNVMLWDDAGEVEVRHTFDTQSERELDLYFVNAPVETSGDDVIVDGNIITAENYDAAAVAHFDGKFLTASDLGREQHYQVDGSILLGEVYDAAGDDVFVDGKIITGDGYAPGKIIAADENGYTALTMSLGADGARVIDVTSY